MKRITMAWLGLAIIYIIFAVVQIPNENWVAIVGCANCAWLCLCMAAEKENK